MVDNNIILMHLISRIFNGIISKMENDGRPEIFLNGAKYFIDAFRNEIAEVSDEFVYIIEQPVFRVDGRETKKIAFDRSGDIYDYDLYNHVLSLVSVYGGLNKAMESADNFYAMLTKRFDADNYVIDMAHRCLEKGCDF